MDKLKPLNKKEVKEILNKLKEQFGTEDLKLDYIFFINSEDKIFLLSNKFKEFDNKVNINSLGIYFATLKEKEIRLSIEGSQIVGKKAKKNIIEIDNDDLRKWTRGEDLDYNENEKGFVLIKNKKDFYGCGRIVKDKIFNYVPKDRRMEII